MKFPARHAPHLHAALMTACMATVMSISLTFIRGGMSEDFVWLSLRNAAVAFPIALLATTLIGPLVRRVVAQLIEPPFADDSRGSIPSSTTPTREGKDHG